MSEITEGITKIAVMYANQFQEGKIDLTFFCQFESPLEIMNILYKNLVNKNELQPVESLSQDVKQKLWDDAKDLCPDADQAKAIRLCNAIWLMNSMLETV